jgi:tetratricopeptide (TPR) repeat protein
LRLVALATAAALLGLAGCAGKRMATPDNEPTLAVLKARELKITPDPGPMYDQAKAMTAYRDFLAAAPRAPQRAEALRRLGDLEMDAADERVGSGQAQGTMADYQAAVTRYQEFLKTHPDDPATDRVIYQLARAHEQGGELTKSLALLDELVTRFPQTRYRDEAQFRRGELLFTARDYVKAEQAYTLVLTTAARTPYHERSQYMQGWSRFKQGRLEDGLTSFFGVLDSVLANKSDVAELAEVPGLTRGDRELAEDTFRVVSISLQNLHGAQSVPTYINTPLRHSYEFRVYQQLAELYLKQERIKDAADTYGAFTARDPLHPQAPILQARVIDIYQQTGFDSQALQAKKAYVQNYGPGSEFRRANALAWDKAQPLVKTHLAELATHYHASAQKTKAPADVQEAVRWYRAYLEGFPNEPEAARSNFLLAELLNDDGKLAEAAAEFEKTAYKYPQHAKSADAGYAALLAYAGQEKRAAPAELPALQAASVESSLRFAGTFARDERAAPVLTNAAEMLFALRDTERAATVARQVVELQPPAAPAQRRVAWTVLAHTAFEQGRFDLAERHYGEVLALVPAGDAARADLVERQAAAIYKQGEASRKAGRTQEAIGHFARVATVAPGSQVRATAQFDVAAAMLETKDWAGATRQLEDLRQRVPNHPLNDDIATKLALAYTEQRQWGPAAGEMERIAASAKDPAVARDAQWQAAELYDKADNKAQSARAYERYVQQHPQPLEPALEARWRLAAMARESGQAPRALALVKAVMQADATGGADRTPRTRTLGALAALELTAPTLDAYRKVALVEPLARQLKLKKARMEDVLKAYAAVSDYGVAEATTAATFHTAALYQDFGKALMGSQRPRKLNKAELEQYNVMLEEQAYPFEEKSIELHEANARRARDGLYDQWVKQSFTALRELRPVRYGKSERAEGVIDAIR